MYMLPEGSPMRGAKLAQSGFSCNMIYLHFEGEKLRIKKVAVSQYSANTKKISSISSKKNVHPKNIKFYLLCRLLIFKCHSKTGLLPFSPAEW